MSCGEFREGDHLVSRVHGDADDTLGQRQLADGVAVAGDQAGHRVFGVDHTVFDPRLHGLEAATTA